MENVMCRPELHDATSGEQYRAFHAGMEQLGLGRTITSGERVFRLPTGEYLGVNLPSLDSLANKINSLAIQITGYPCKLTLEPVDPAKIYISGLEEEVPYFAELGVSLPGSFAWLRDSRL